MKENSCILVSVIVPIYNVEQFVDKCVESIIAQTHKNLEIILVDDGSSDNSGRIVDEYAKKDNRIKVIHKKNGGVSSARNFGLKKATGDYISFIDGDDWVSKDYIEYFICIVKKTGADFIIMKNNFTSFCNKQAKDGIEIWDKEHALVELIAPNIAIGSWNKFYKRDLLRDNNVVFDEPLYMGEGLKFITDVTQCADKIAVGHRKTYYYRKNNVTSATTVFRAEKMEAANVSLEKIRKDLTINSEKVLGAIDDHIYMNHFYGLKQIINNKSERNHAEIYQRHFNYIKTHKLRKHSKRSGLKWKSVEILVSINPFFAIKITNLAKKVIHK